jgi:hypothetical protein
MRKSTKVGKVEVSTVMLSLFSFGRYPYETCLFYDDDRPSEVVDTYDTWPDAEIGHEAWVTMLKEGRYP